MQRIGVGGNVSMLAQDAFGFTLKHLWFGGTAQHCQTAVASRTVGQKTSIELFRATTQKRGASGGAKAC